MCSRRHEDRKRRREKEEREDAADREKEAAAKVATPDEAPILKDIAGVASLANIGAWSVISFMAMDFWKSAQCIVFMAADASCVNADMHASKRAGTLTRMRAHTHICTRSRLCIQDD